MLNRSSDCNRYWDEYLEKECGKKASKLYGGIIPERVKKRIGREMSLVRGTDFSYLLIRAAEISNFSKSIGKKLSYRGCLGSSFLAYLLGISMVDPLSATPILPCEFFYGYEGEKKPDISLFVSKEVKEKFKNERGIHLYSEEDICDLPDDEYKLIKDKERDLFHYYSHSMEDEIKVFGLLHGTGTWEGNGKEKLLQGWNSKDLIAYREDVLHSLLHFGVNWAIAFQMAEKTGKGKLTEQDLRDLYAMGVPDEYIQSMKKIHYLFPKAHGIECVRLGLF